MPWFILILASLFEVAWVASLKRISGIGDILNITISLSLLLVSVSLLITACRSVPISVAYAIWTGAGAVGALVVGAVWYNESLNIQKIVCVSLIVIGVSGLKFAHVTNSGGV